MHEEEHKIHPAVVFARYLGCDEDLIYDKISEYPEPFHESPEMFRSYTADMAENTRIGNAASELAVAISKSKDSKRVERILGASVDDIRRLAAFFFQERDDLAVELTHKPRQGGKRRDALIVASFVRDVFVSLGIPVSAQHISGQPTSHYGRAVREALGFWMVNVDWRRPSEAAIRGEPVTLMANWELRGQPKS
jgi:hypothetical protein